MILIEVDFEKLHRTYDFKADENLQVADLIDQMLQSVSQSEHISLAGNYGLYLLADRAKKEIFSPTMSLSECGVRSGDKLILV